MKPILPSRPNHSWLRRRFFGPAISWNSPLARIYHAPWSSGLTSLLCCAATRGATMNQLDLKGKAAVVTGGAAGIGLAIAQRLAASGARVSLWDRDEKALAEAARALGGNTHIVRLDVADEADVKRACDE